MRSSIGRDARWTSFSFPPYLGCTPSRVTPQATSTPSAAVSSGVQLQVDRIEEQIDEIVLIEVALDVAERPLDDLLALEPLQGRTLPCA